MRSAISASDTPLMRIQSRSSISGFLVCAPLAPIVLPSARLAEVLAVLLWEVIDLLPVADRDAAAERLANHALGFGMTPGGSEAAAMLGAVGSALVRLEG